MIRPPVRTPLALLILLAFTAPLHAQDPSTAVGRIAGRVVDDERGDPIPSAQVTVEGTAITVLTNWTGRYTLDSVPQGIHSVSVRTIGRSSKVITGVTVVAGRTTPLDITLSNTAVQLEAITVSAEQERGSVSAALNQQRTADQITNAVTEEQIRRSPDSDAGEAVQRVSGVSVEDGKYVFVRGLGERYTTTALNGARVPSPEPDHKVVPFDLFPSSLLESITTSKTFTPDQPGDFSGASVNLKTREFPLRSFLAFSSSGGATTGATAADIPIAPTVGTEWLGFAGSEREIPPPADPLRTPSDLSRLSQSEMDGVIGSFRNAWSARNAAGRGIGSIGVSTGGRGLIGSAPVGYLGSFTYATEQEGHLNERHALAVSDGNGGARPQNSYFGTTATAGVLWGGILNLTTELGSSKLAFNNTYSRSADNEATQLAGTSEEFAQAFDITRLTFTERYVRSSQLRGEHHFGDRQTADWAVSSSSVRRYEPDRSEIIYQATVDTIAHTSQPTAWWGASRSAVRTFGDLHESVVELSGNYKLAWGPPGRGSALKLGANYRAVDRTEETRPFEIDNLDLSVAERSGTPETIFDGAYAADGRMLLLLNANGGYYTANDHLGAGYVQFEVALGDRGRLITGVRAEDSRLRLHTVTAQGLPSDPAPKYFDILPAAALTIRLTRTQNLRFSASQTLSRPEYREISVVPHAENGFEGLIIMGNDSLKRALIQNYDARWEWYPTPAEVVSIGLFAKTFDQPIEKVIVGSTGASTLSFVNADGATNYGVELELRKNLSTISAALTAFTLFANTTLMHSRIRPGNEGISSNTSAERPMQGQAAYVVNLGLSATSGGGRISATGLYNVVGRRIAEVGQVPVPDAYEQPRHVVDCSAQALLTSHLAMRFDAKNLLNAPYEVLQGTVTRLSYTTGRVFTVGFTWTL